MTELNNNSNSIFVVEIYGWENHQVHSVWSSAAAALEVSGMLSNSEDGYDSVLVQEYPLRSDAKSLQIFYTASLAKHANEDYIFSGASTGEYIFEDTPNVIVNVVKETGDVYIQGHASDKESANKLVISEAEKLGLDMSNIKAKYLS